MHIRWTTITLSLIFIVGSEQKLRWNLKRIEAFSLYTNLSIKICVNDWMKQTKTSSQFRSNFCRVWRQLSQEMRETCCQFVRCKPKADSWSAGFGASWESRCLECWQTRNFVIYFSAFSIEFDCCSLAKINRIRSNNEETRKTKIWSEGGSSSIIWFWFMSWLFL